MYRGRSPAQRGIVCASALGVSLFLIALDPSYGAAQSCRQRLAHIDVDTAKHRLSLCEAGHEKAWYNVRLGRGGVGKRREGDGRTPLGTYPIGRPRPSAKYGIFVPIGYPTPEQRARGYSGSAVGIHGPHRSFTWLGRVTNLFDTTRGCIGIATDVEMREVGRWLVRTRASLIVLRPELVNSISAQ